MLPILSTLGRFSLRIREISVNALLSHKKYQKILFRKSEHLPAQRRRSGVFIVNFEYISQLDLVFLLFTLNIRLLTGYCVGVKDKGQQNLRDHP